MQSLFDKDTAPQKKGGDRGAPQSASQRFLRRIRRPRFRTRHRAGRAVFYTLLGLSAVFGCLVGLMLVYSTDLPQMEDLEHYRPNTTSELLDIHGQPFGSFALERRVVVPYTDFPLQLRQAILSIEDKSFDRNVGVNPFRALAAAYRDIHSHGRKQGASTLTMQLARNLFLSAEQTWKRKILEIFLALQIERRFTKHQIFSLYANQIYLGHGTYGFEAGSQFYFSKRVRDLTLPEAALLAALPKGPESYSPIRHPDRALRRRNLVLSEMLEDGDINAQQYNAAHAAPLGLRIEPTTNSVAPYFVEEVRRQLEQQYGVERVHGAGLRIYTTLDLDLQQTANKAVMDGTATYERRHGWKGRLPNVLASSGDMATYRHPDWTQQLQKGNYLHALVTDVKPRVVTLRIGQRSFQITQPDWAWTQFSNAGEFLSVGDIAYVRIESVPPDENESPKATLQQDSGAQASLMAVDNSNGEVLAMIGGRDFALSQFNRATQAERQTGSSFKPYVYTAAIEAGAKPTDIIVDGPTTFQTPGGPYTPHNYEAGYKGPMTLIEAFAESRNIPALKLASHLGIRKVIEVAHRFGVTSNLPAFLPVALGSAGISLAEQVGSYSVFPNDGIRIEPHYIRRVVQADGLPLPEITPQVKEVISLETARTMMRLLQAVTQYGTGAQAGAILKHPLGGKTGTTNDYTDAWFVGFSPSVTCGTWIGFDDRRTLGEKETGARAALPMWIDFMKAAIARTPSESFASTAAKKALDLAKPTVRVPRAPVKPADDDDPDASDNNGTQPKKSTSATDPTSQSAVPNDSAGQSGTGASQSFGRSAQTGARPIVIQQGVAIRPRKPVAAPVVVPTAPPQ